MSTIWKETNKAHYYEHYPHYMGTLNRQFTFDITKMDEIVALMKTQDDRELADDEQCAYELLDSLGDAYALGDLARDWPAIRKALEKKGEWGGEWEEGSHAISMNNMTEARKSVGKIEAEVFERCGEW